MDEGKHRGMEKNGWYYETVRCNFVITVDHTKKNVGGKSCIPSVSRLFFHSMPATACQPSGHHASLQSWHTRSDQSGRRRTVLVKDKGTHLWGFAANRRLFAWTKPRRGAQATVASDSVMASFQGRQGHGEKDGTLPSQHNTHICKQKPPYGEQNISDALNVLAMASPQGRDQKQRWHHAKRKQGGIHGCHQKPYKSVVNADTKIVAEGLNQSQMQLWWEYGTKNISSMPTLFSANCCTGRKEAAAHYKELQGIVLFHYEDEDYMEEEK